MVGFHHTANMKILLSLALLSLLVGCAAPQTKPVPTLNALQMTTTTNWIPSGLWTDTDGKMWFLERCNHVTNGVHCAGDWFIAKPAVTSGTFTNGIPNPMLRQFYPPIPFPTRPQPARDPLGHP